VLNDSSHSEKKVVPATRNLRINTSAMYYKVAITTMNK